MSAEAGGDGSVDTGFIDAFITWLAANPRTFSVAEDASGHLIGMLNVSVFERMPKPGSPASVWVYLANAYVLPANRNARVGGQLPEGAVAFAWSIRAARMVTAPSDASKEFYALHVLRPRKSWPSIGRERTRFTQRLATSVSLLRRGTNETFEKRRKYLTGPGSTKETRC